LCLLLQDVLNDALVVGEALGLQQQAAAAVAALQQRMDTAKALVAQLPPLQHPKVRSTCAAYIHLQVLL
jgi:ABC-type Fe3+-hydroxamate transport system substrate-binding protein